MAQRDASPHPKPPTTQSELESYDAFETYLLENERLEVPGSLCLTDIFSWNKGHKMLTADTHPIPMSYLNHGAFGDPYPSTLILRQYLTSLCYRQPMVYHRSIVPILHARAKKKVCDYLKIQNKDDFSFIAVTPAIFGVVNAVNFEEGDVIVTSDMIYHSLVDAISHIVSVKKLHWVQVESPHGCDPEATYVEFERVLHIESSLRTVRLVVFDHISSKPTVMFPVNKICKLCRSLKIPTLVDGAHVPGSIPTYLIDVESTEATFYCMTFHKWVNTPRGNSGGLWVNKKDIQCMYSSFIDISGLCVGGGLIDDRGDYEMHNDASKPGYIIDGLTQGIYDESTREYENILVLPHCLDIVLINEYACQQHALRLRSESFKLLSEAWGLAAEETEQWGGLYSLGDVALPMVAIPLPTKKLVDAAQFENDGLALGEKLKLLKNHLVPKLWEEYAIEVPIFVWKQTIVGVRISFGRHVMIEDIIRLGNAINTIIEQGFSCGKPSERISDHHL